jgi:type I restriction enzyme S subunit
MIAGLQSYEEYRESGSPWLGLVPRHWEIRQARHIGRLLKGVGGTKEDAVTAGVPCVRYGELYTTFTYFVRVTKTFVSAERASGYMPVQYGDVLFAASGETIEDIGKSAVNLMRTPAVCGGDVIVLRPSIPVHAPFLGYAMDCRSATNQKATMGRGTTVKHIYPDELRGLLFPLPTLDEQAGIVRFLDWANGRLERAIRAKRKVIALLNEQKQGITHRTVTRGLDPSAPLKPSGIPWIGAIPAHWEVFRSKYIYREVDNRSATGGERHLSMSQKYGLIPSSQIEEKHLVSESYAGAKLCKKGDLVLNRLKAHLGVFALAREGGLVSPDYTVLRPARDLEDRYFEAVYRTPACRVELRQRAKGIVEGFWRLYTDDLYDIRMPVPPVEEQRRIMAHLDVDLLAINTATTRLEREIEFLREYRTRLVADVVIGKLDVRDAAARLPDEVEHSSQDFETDLSDEGELADEKAVA